MKAEILRRWPDIVKEGTPAVRSVMRRVNIRDINTKKIASACKGSRRKIKQTWRSIGHIKNNM
jgi:hypothetical protein